MCTLERRVIYSHRMKRKSPGLRAAWHASVQYNSASNDGICKQKTFLGLNIILLPHPTQKPQMIFEKNSPLSFVKLNSSAVTFQNMSTIWFLKREACPKITVTLFMMFFCSKSDS
jgi:hypothetical protein